MWHFLFLTVLLLLFPFSAAQNVYAQEEKFETSYNIDYFVFENGTTRVTQNITLKNKTDDYRPSEYTLELSLTDIKNVQAQDADGPISPAIEKGEDKTRIKLIFNQVVIGKDRILPFKISFESLDFAKKKGLLWEINIPGIEDKTGIIEYNATLAVPSSFGKPAIIKPVKNFADGKLFWTKEEIPKSGIILTFGDFQIYNLDLKYHLKNPRLYPIQTEIALPPETNYQKVFLQKINPQPLNVKLDEDGNWLASFKLSPNSSLTVNVKLTTKIFLNPATSQKLSEDKKKTYLLPQKYWEVNDKAVQELASFFKTPRQIYDFVVGELDYDIKRVEKELERQGARNVLQNKNSAICMEFTDLFVAIARAAKIPAREINGFAYTENQKFRPLSLVRDVLHAWPEYYLEEKNTWIMIDPTWGNTTGQDFFEIFDFDHIVFVIKGVNSEYPIPAGGYKTSESQDSRDVNVSLGDLKDFSEKRELNIKFLGPQKLSSFLPLKTTFLVENLGNAKLPPQTIKISVDNLTPIPRYLQIDELLPLGKQEISLDFDKGWFSPEKKAIIRLETENKTWDFKILVSPFAVFEKNLVFLLGGGIFGFSLISYAAFRVWRLYFSRQKEKDSLRRQGQQPEKESRQLLR